MADYGTSALVHARLNIADSVTDVDDKITDYLEEADEFINTQLGVHESTPPSPIPVELTALGSSSATALYNYWNSPDKPAEGIKMYSKKIQDYIRANHAKKSESGLAGDNNVLKTASHIKGTET